MDELSLTRHPASIGTRPVRWAPGDIAEGAGAPLGLPLWWNDTWTRARDGMSGSAARAPASPHHDPRPRPSRSR